MAPSLRLAAGVTFVSNVATVKEKEAPLISIGCRRAASAGGGGTMWSGYFSLALSQEIRKRVSDESGEVGRGTARVRRPSNIDGSRRRDRAKAEKKTLASFAWRFFGSALGIIS